jgi:lincosamide nucleotidyltransferase
MEQTELAQEQMIARMRSLCEQDSRIVAAVLYGSFALGEGDAFSDIEAVFFLPDGQLAALDQCAWLRQIEPVHVYFADDFGTRRRSSPIWYEVSFTSSRHPP